MCDAGWVGAERTGVVACERLDAARAPGGYALPSPMPASPNPFATIPEILDELRAGRMVILTDDEDRENEGDLVLPAQFATPEAVTFMLRHALGYLCLSLTEADCDRLGLHPQSSVNTTARGTAFTVSIDLHVKHGGTTGVSAKERARCIQMAVDPRFNANDFVRPGHINPLRSRDGGVLVRNGQTEGSVDLCRLAGLHPAACIIEIMREDGEMARVPDLVTFCNQHGIKMCSVAQIIQHRLSRESLITRLSPQGGHPLRTPEGEFRAHLFQSVVDPLPHLVLTVGDVGAGLAPSDTPTLVRMHRRHLLGDVFGDLSSSTDGTPSGQTLRDSMRMIQREGRGAIVYLRTSGGAVASGGVPGVGGVGGAAEELGLADLESLLQAPRGKRGSVDDPNLAAAVMPLREYGVGCQILRALGLSRLRLISNSRRPLPGLEHFGLEIVGYEVAAG